MRENISQRYILWLSVCIWLFNVYCSHMNCYIVVEFLNTTSMSGKYAVIWRSLDCCWDNKEVTQNIPVFYASGIAEPGANIGILYIGPKGSNCNQDPKMSRM